VAVTGGAAGGQLPSSRGNCVRWFPPPASGTPAKLDVERRFCRASGTRQAGDHFQGLECRRRNTALRAGPDPWSIFPGKQHQSATRRHYAAIVNRRWESL